MQIQIIFLFIANLIYTTQSYVMLAVPCQEMRLILK